MSLNYAHGSRIAARRTQNRAWNEPGPVCQAFNDFVWRVLQDRGIAFDVLHDAPSTLGAAVLYYSRHRRVAVWAGASDRTIFADPETNHAFRAWHDYHHIIGGHGFNAEGETAVCQAQIADVMRLVPPGITRTLLCALLECEVLGQLAYETRWGKFPDDQAAFARDYLRQPSAALAGIY